MNDFNKILLLFTAAGLLLPLSPLTELLTEHESHPSVSDTDERASLTEIIETTRKSVERIQAELSTEGQPGERELIKALEEEYASALGLGASSPYEVPQLSFIALRARSGLQHVIAASARVERFLNSHHELLNEIKLERIRRFGRERKDSPPTKQTQ